jgi:hypothetical protein
MLAASIIRAMIALMMDAASTSETPVTFYQTTRCNSQNTTSSFSCDVEVQFFLVPNIFIFHHMA